MGKVSPAPSTNMQPPPRVLLSKRRRSTSSVSKRAKRPPLRPLRSLQVLSPTLSSPLEMPRSPVNYVPALYKPGSIETLIKPSNESSSTSPHPFYNLEVTSEKESRSDNKKELKLSIVEEGSSSELYKSNENTLSPDTPLSPLTKLCRMISSEPPKTVPRLYRSGSIIKKPDENPNPIVASHLQPPVTIYRSGSTEPTKPPVSKEKPPTGKGANGDPLNPANLKSSQLSWRNIVL